MCNQTSGCAELGGMTDVYRLQMLGMVVGVSHSCCKPAIVSGVHDKRTLNAHGLHHCITVPSRIAKGVIKAQAADGLQYDSQSCAEVDMCSFAEPESQLTASLRQLEQARRAPRSRKATRLKGNDPPVVMRHSNRTKDASLA